MKASTNAIPDLRDRRLQVGLSQQRLAERAGCSIATVRFVERGGRCSPEMAVRLLGTLATESIA